MVSIHAPGRGATRDDLKNADVVPVSIHAPGRGATRPSPETITYIIRFQFTHPGGVRLFFSFVLGLLIPFQFTHPGGVRRATSSLMLFPRPFQFTHPGGVRHRRFGDSTFPACFNSRTREGCDMPRRSSRSCKTQFQFTHPGGVRQDWEHIPSELISVSIHAPGRGATSYCL